MSSNLTLDRRILKAFYTQYVSVLLIVLVFSVGIASRKAQHSNKKALATLSDGLDGFIGELELKELFAGEQSAQIKDERELEAVLEMLRNHDVKATFTVHAAVQPDMSQSFSLAMSRARSIRSRAIDTHVPARAVRLLVAASRDSVVDAKVSFRSMESSDESS